MKRLPEYHPPAQHPSESDRGSPPGSPNKNHLLPALDKHRRGVEAVAQCIGIILGRDRFISRQRPGRNLSASDRPDGQCQTKRRDNKYGCRSSHSCSQTVRITPESPHRRAADAAQRESAAFFLRPRRGVEAWVAASSSKSRKQPTRSIVSIRRRVSSSPR